jgi:hypothetical protein
MAMSTVAAQLEGIKGIEGIEGIEEQPTDAPVNIEAISQQQTSRPYLYISKTWQLRYNTSIHS